MKKKKRLGIIAGVIVLLAVIGGLATPPSDSVRADSIAISIADQQEEYDVGTTIPVTLTVEPENASTEELEYETSSPSVHFSEDGIFTGTQEGDFEVFVQCGSVKSNTLNISVADITSREKAQQFAEQQAALEAEAQQLAEERAALETEAQQLEEERAALEAEAQQLAEERAALEKAQTAQAAAAQEDQGTAPQSSSDSSGSVASSSSASSADTSSGAGSSDMVWIPRTGSKYHSNSSCSNMKNPRQVTVDYAISLGYEPCKKCY